MTVLTGGLLVVRLAKKMAKQTSQQIGRILSLSLMIFLAGCAKPYEASFVAAISKVPPPPSDNFIICDYRPAFADHVALIMSPDFWSKYVLPRLGPEASPKWREGVSISEGKSGTIGDTRTFEFVIRVREGGEKVFDAVCDSYDASFEDSFRKLNRVALADLRAEIAAAPEETRPAFALRLSEAEAWQKEIRILSRRKP